MAKKRPRPADDPRWQPVHVGLPDPQADVNHYDDDDDDAAKPNKASRLRPNDLEGRSSEEMAFFYNLEVIPANSYQVEEKEGVKHIRLKAARTDEDKDVAKKSPATYTNEAIDADPAEPKKKKAKKKKKKAKADGKEAQTESAARKPAASEATTSTIPSQPESADDDRTEKIQALSLSWMSAAGGVELHPNLCERLLDMGFWTPTPVQAATLAASILGRRNIAAAAPTGSGKTLAFLLPIAQDLLSREDEETPLPLQALILTPTRELALQIHGECQKLLPGSVGTIVGGLAEAKQARVLKKNRPPILVGTVGRLWELMSKREYEHLNDLSQVRYLVIDEADRMIQQGSVPQLRRILDALHRANPMDGDEEEEEEEDQGGDQEEDSRLLGLPGVPGEARLTMLSEDILRRIDEQREGGRLDMPAESDDEPDDDEFQGVEVESDHEEEDRFGLLTPSPLQRRTYIYSATLTLPASETYAKSKRARVPKNVDGAIAEILEMSRANGETKVVDLSNGGDTKLATEKKSARKVTKAKQADDKTQKKFNLPPGLQLEQIKCTQKHKDSHLYGYLMTTEQGSSGPCLVFCNSIAAVRRVGSTLQMLGMDVRILHAKMEQRARFKAVESLKQSKTRKIVIATDVAARGLDIPSVATVVHYDAARTVDTFVHRAGRTARGMGDGAVGSSLSLIAPSEDKIHSRIVSAVQAQFEAVHLDGRLLIAAQERVSLASKIVEVGESEQRTNRNNQWFKQQAADAGLEVEDDMLEEGLANDNDPRSRSLYQESRKAKACLRQLLAEPIQTQRYGKFLSTNSATKQRVIVEPVTEMPQALRGKAKKRRKHRK